ncbi:MAG TPA: metalloprotease family protein [bacterium]|nr:DUF3267 domain-containing protein [Patescibacteria group bacterium]HOC96217.1 metalloprotease family protein [bacterium]HPO11203.1 metalloprotease family protein [bacterium]
MINEIFSLISLPGVVFHEFGHEMFCYFTGVKVIKVCYFQFKNPAGYVLHFKPKKYYQSFLISVGPFILGLIFSIFFFLISKYYNSINNQFFEILFIWLGASIAINSFQSKEDIKVLFKETNNHIIKNPFVLLAYPVILVMFLFSLLNNLFINLIYAFLLYILSSYIFLNFK